MVAVEYNKYIDILKTRLTSARLEHSKLVAEHAKRLAKFFGADELKAETAGLLHDIMKDSKQEVLLQTILGFGIILTDIEKSAPKLWHAIAGEITLRNELKIKDEDILNAIRYHTTARKNMSTLEKVLYLADFISDDRDYEGVNEIRDAISKGLAIGMKAALIFSINDLVRNNKPIHPDTIDAYNEVILIN